MSHPTPARRIEKQGHDPQLPLSVIVIAFNEERYLPDLLTSLSKQTAGGFQLILCDSASSDETPKIAVEWAKQFPHFRYHHLDEPRGPGFARNRGAELACHERLLFLDADTRLEPDFLSQAFAELAGRKLDTATCRMRVTEKRLSNQMGSWFLNGMMQFLKPVYATAYGACLFSTCTVHREIGGFREDLALCEDCHYVKQVRQCHSYRFGILQPCFFTSDRRARLEGGLKLMSRYVRAHTYRMLTGKEIEKGKFAYDYGDY